MNATLKPRALLGLFFVAAAIAACGGASEGAAPKAPSSVEATPTQEPQTVEEAQAELERARAALSGTGAGAGATAGATPATPPPINTAAPPAPVSPQVAPAAGGAQPTSTCDSVCRAITSMHHAKDAICRLAGPTDPRCADAKKKVADGDAQAASCSCPVK